MYPVYREDKDIFHNPFVYFVWEIFVPINHYTPDMQFIKIRAQKTYSQKIIIFKKRCFLLKRNSHTGKTKKQTK